VRVFFKLGNQPLLGFFLTGWYSDQLLWNWRSLSPIGRRTVKTAL